MPIIVPGPGVGVYTQEDVDDLLQVERNRIAALEQAGSPGPGPQGPPGPEGPPGPPGGVSLAGYGVLHPDNFGPGNDTQRWVKAMRYASQQTFKPMVAMEPGVVLDAPPGGLIRPGGSASALLDGVDPFDGLCTGFLTPTDQEFSYLNRVIVTGGPFLVPKQGTSVQTRGIKIWNISFEMNSGAPWFQQTVGGTVDGANGPILSYGVIRGCSFDGCREVFYGRLLGMDAFDWSYTNNVINTPYRLWGSDNSLFQTFALGDSPNLADNEFLVILEHMTKSTVGVPFLTGDGPTPMRVNGGNGGLILQACKLEAQGAPRLMAGTALLLNGGYGTVRDAWVYKYMNNPAGTGRGDQAAIQINGGNWLIDGTQFDSSGSPAGTAHVYVADAVTQVLLRTGRDKSGIKPGVKFQGATAQGKTDLDSSFQILP